MMIPYMELFFFFQDYCLFPPLSFKKKKLFLHLSNASLLSVLQLAIPSFLSTSLSQWGVVKAAAAGGEQGVAHPAITQLDRIR